MFINFDGDLVESSQNILHHSNRIFRYGDGVFESMVMFDKRVKLISLHARRLAMGAQLLELILPEKLHENKISEEVEKLCEANGFTNARIRIVLFRNSGGFYAPLANEGGFIIEATEIETNNFEFNERGLSIGIYPDIVKPVNILSNIKTCNALLYVKAGLFKNHSGVDECILLNENNKVCESISHNLFWVKDKKIFTPSRHSGCILGVMRNFLIHYFKENNIDHEEGEYSIDDILHADELFLSGATSGIQWVNELTLPGNKIIYTNTITKQLFNALFN